MKTCGSLCNTSPFFRILPRLCQLPHLLASFFLFFFVTETPWPIFCFSETFSDLILGINERRLLKCFCVLFLYCTGWLMYKKEQIVVLVPGGGGLLSLLGQSGPWVSKKRMVCTLVCVCSVIICPAVLLFGWLTASSELWRHSSGLSCPWTHRRRQKHSARTHCVSAHVCSVSTFIHRICCSSKFN